MFSLESEYFSVSKKDVRTLEEVKDGEESNTQKYQKHVANRFCLKYNIYRPFL
jgi:hypothetical protein